MQGASFPGDPGDAGKCSSRLQEAWAGEGAAAKGSSQFEVRPGRRPTQRGGRKPRPLSSRRGGGWSRAERSTRTPRAPGRASPEDSVRLCLLCGRGSNLGSYSLSPQDLLLSQPEPRGPPPPARCLRGRTGRRRRWPTRRTAGVRPPGAAAGPGARLRAPLPPRRLVWIWLSCPERKAQKTLYFGGEINSPRTVKIHLCKLHCTPHRIAGPGFCSPRSSGRGLSVPFLRCFLEPNLVDCRSRAPGQKPSQPAGPSFILSFFG